jgi:hypothetical protein
MNAETGTAPGRRMFVFDSEGMVSHQLPCNLWYLVDSDRRLMSFHEEPPTNEAGDTFLALVDPPDLSGVLPFVESEFCKLCAATFGPSHVRPCRVAANALARSLGMFELPYKPPLKHLQTRAAARRLAQLSKQAAKASLVRP